MKDFCPTIGLITLSKPSISDSITACHLLGIVLISPLNAILKTKTINKATIHEAITESVIGNPNTENTLVDDALTPCSSADANNGQPCTKHNCSIQNDFRRKKLITHCHILDTNDKRNGKIIADLS